jgi:hypothetical protein
VGGTASPLAAVTYHLSMPANLENKDTVIFEMSHSVKEQSFLSKLTLPQPLSLLTSSKMS